MPTTKFCTVAQAKALANIEPAFTGYDSQVIAHIKASTALIRAYTRRYWEKALYVEYFSAPDIHSRFGGSTLELQLGEKPLSETPALEVRYSRSGDFGNADPLIVDQDYTIDYSKNKIVFYPARIRSSQQSIQVKYTAGFPIDTGTPADPNATPPVSEVPADTELLLVDTNLQQACAMQAAFMYRRLADGEEGQNYKQNKRGIATFGLKSSGLIPEVQAILKNYVKLNIGRG